MANNYISDPTVLPYDTPSMPGRIINAAYAQNGELLACALDSSILAFQHTLENRHCSLIEMPRKEPFLLEFMESTQLLHTDRNELLVLNLEKEAYTACFSGHTSSVHCISCSSIIEGAITVSLGEAYVWDIREKNPHARIPVQGCPIIKYSPDGNIFMALFRERNEMCLFDTRSYMSGPYKIKQIAPNIYNDMYFSPDSFGLALALEDGFCIADGFSGDVTMLLSSDFATGGCWSHDSRSFLYTTGPSEISISTIPESRSELVFSADDGSYITSLHYNPCYDQIAVIHNRLTFLQNAPTNYVSE